MVKDGGKVLFIVGELSLAGSVGKAQMSVMSRCTIHKAAAM